MFIIYTVEFLVFCARFIVNLLTFFALELPLQLLGALLLLIYMPFAQSRIQLPFMLRWFDCADLYSEFDRSPVTYLTTVLPNGWWTRYCWLAWRNPTNYFSYKYLSYKCTGKETYTILGNIDVGDSTGDMAGFKYIILGDIYEYSYIYKWSSTTCFRFRMGYKIGNTENKPNSYIQGVFVISPYKSYSGL